MLMNFVLIWMVNALQCHDTFSLSLYTGVNRYMLVGYQGIGKILCLYKYIISKAVAKALKEGNFYFTKDVVKPSLVWNKAINALPWSKSNV